jgi:hypothetical protein
MTLRMSAAYATMNRDHALNQPNADQFANYPALACLRLEVDDLAELARQGFVSPERRLGRTRYKLRFRRGRRQVVRLIGGTQEAVLVQKELGKLQSQRRLIRELKTLDRHARQALRDSKSRLMPLIERHGFTFHGRAIRRPRRSA